MSARSSLIWSIIGTTALLLGATAPVQAAPELGEELFNEYCAGCHGAGAAGLRDYRGSLENFNERLEGVTENMPDFAGFFDSDEIEAMHEYLMAALEAGE